MPITPKTLSEQLLFITARIETAYSDGSKGVGTGFFYSSRKNGEAILMLITNNHVLTDNCITASYQVHLADIATPLVPKREVKRIDITNVATAVQRHPDPDIDLCAINISKIQNFVFPDNTKPYHRALDESDIPNSDQLSSMSALEEIMMIGYPIGLIDEHNTLPLLRRGTTASHYSLDFNGKPNFVVDMAYFQGSSGSPIVICNEGMHFANNALLPSSRLLFLGILHSGPIRTIQGEIRVETIPTLDRVYSETKVPIHLGYAVKAPQVLPIAEKLWEKVFASRATPSTPVTLPPP